eukprot:1218024-Pyramimonas_sp.AAC.2
MHPPHAYAAALPDVYPVLPCYWLRVTIAHPLPIEPQSGLEKRSAWAGTPFVAALPELNAAPSLRRKAARLSRVDEQTATAPQTRNERTRVTDSPW